MTIAKLQQTMVATGAGTLLPSLPAGGIPIRGRAALVFGGTAPVATVQLERSIDNGATWAAVSLAGTGVITAFAMTAAVIGSVFFDEPCSEVLYRCNCTAYTSGTVVTTIMQ
jgi:hypothetical protein